MQFQTFMSHLANTSSGFRRSPSYSAQLILIQSTFIACSLTIHCMVMHNFLYSKPSGRTPSPKSPSWRVWSYDRAAAVHNWDTCFKSKDGDVCSYAISWNTSHRHNMHSPFISLSQLPLLPLTQLQTSPSSLHNNGPSRFDWERRGQSVSVFKAIW